tara:strand:+ start:16 stop:855 length:840 start_codon:yes stop_codon:yes gene_type:complete
MIVSQEQCINDFIRYQKKEKIFNKEGKLIGTDIKIIYGITSDKPGYIHISINENNQFEDKPTKVPKGYKKVNKPAFIKDIAKDFYCTQKKKVSNKQGNTKKVIKGSKQSTKNTKKSKKLNIKLKGALEFAKWYNNSRKYWLTIKDIERMKNKGKIVVLPLHRNVLDGPQTYHKENTPYKPETFFKTEKDTFVNYGNMSGIFIKYDQHDKTPKPLDIEYKKDKWYPLFDGYLPDKDVQTGNKLLGKKKHWTEFKKNSHIGFRGPMILWDDLKKLPKLYFD